MKMQIQNNPHTARNLVIFAMSVVTAGWLGWGLDSVMGNSPTQGLGQLIWLLAPLSTALLLRAFARDGWRDFGIRPAIRSNGGWYLVSLLVCPVGAALVLGAGLALGLVTFPGFSAESVAHFLQLFALGLLPAFIINIFEEFAWRGYLSPKVHSLGWNVFAGHLVVGLIWAAWHIPYYLNFLDRTVFQAYTTQSLATFIPMMFAGVIALSIVYGEIRLLTNSVWPTLLLHTISSALINPLLTQGVTTIAPGMDFLVSPGPHSLLSIVVFTLLGIGLYALRKRQSSNAALPAGEPRPALIQS